MTCPSASPVRPRWSSSWPSRRPLRRPPLRRRGRRPRGDQGPRGLRRVRRDPRPEGPDRVRGLARRSRRCSPTRARRGAPVEDVVPATPASNGARRVRAPARARRHPHRRPRRAGIGGGAWRRAGAARDRLGADRARRAADRAELARRRRRRLLGQRRRAQPDRAGDRRHVTGPRGAAGQGRHRARRADDDLHRQPVLRRRHLARHAPDRRGHARAAAPARAPAATCCAAPGSSTAPPPAGTSPCSPPGRWPGSPCSRLAGLRGRRTAPVAVAAAA